MPEPLLDDDGDFEILRGTPVLQNVDFTAWPSEVHALGGRERSGQKHAHEDLNGVYPSDSGTIRIVGQDAQLRSPHDAHTAGISMIFQEHTLAGHLRGAEHLPSAWSPSRPPGDQPEDQSTRAGSAGSHGFHLKGSTEVHALTSAESKCRDRAARFRAPAAWW